MELLTDEQRKAFEAVKEGKSIFLTGPGGTGKSFLLRLLYEKIPELTGRRVAVTALTGCAAVLLGDFATTLHSWAGIGLGTEPATVLASVIKKMKLKVSKKDKTAKNNWMETDILIIDEISMLTPELLEKLNIIGQLVRKSEKLMGGLQIVFVGDFYQLPPVQKDQETGFVFESPLWKELVSEVCHLTKIQRQDDPAFQTILTEARKGELSAASIRVLESRTNQPWRNLEIRPTLLFTKRAEVDMINKKNLAALEGERHIYKVKTVFAPTLATIGLTDESPDVKRIAEKMDKTCSYVPELVLVKEAQVMLLSNLDQKEGLVNGSRGKVIGFNEAEGEDMLVPLVKFQNGKVLTIFPTTWKTEALDGMMRKQIPLCLAYAITIHKAQGATLDCALIDIGRSTFEYGQAYVALSRVKNLQSLYVWELEASAFRAHPKVRDYYESL
jgi:ATP-dependent DNA helicase PIF1